MKTWIIILTILYFALKFSCRSMSNYIKNNSEERIRYIILGGSTSLGCCYSILSIIKSLVLYVDAVLMIIFLINKF